MSRHKRTALFPALLLLLATASFLPAHKPQLWNIGEAEAPHSGLTQFDVLVAGRSLEATRPEGVRVYRRDAGFCDVVVQEVEILTVIKGSGLQARDVIPVLVIPEISDVADGQGDPPPGWTFAQALDFRRVTGDFPVGVHLRRARAFAVGEERLFALFKPSFRDNVEGEWLVWSGADSLRAIPNLHALTVSLPLVGDGSDVAGLVRYVQIDKVQDIDERIRLFGEHSLAVLRDPEAPEGVARAAVLDLGRYFDDPSWPAVRKTLDDGREAEVRARFTAEYLTEAEMAELVDRALNPKTPLFLRRELMLMFWSIRRNEAWRPYHFDPAGFLKLAKDRSEEFHLRRAAVSLLDDIGGERVTAAFREILAKGNDEERRLLYLTREAFRQRERQRQREKP